MVIQGDRKEEVFNSLKGKANLDLSMDIHTGKLSMGINGYIEGEADLMFYNLITDENRDVYLHETDQDAVNSIVSPNEKYTFGAGSMDGNITENNKTTAHQFISIFRSEIVDKVGGGDLGDTAMHELLEAYIGAIFKTGAYSKKTFDFSHGSSMSIYSLPVIFESFVKVGKKWYFEGIKGPKGIINYEQYKQERGK